MSMKKPLITVLLLFLLLGLNTGKTSAQFINNYGINVGFSLVNQQWTQKSRGQILFNTNYLKGVSFMVQAEKEINPIADFRLETGYLKKGFSDEFTLISESGDWLGNVEIPLILHNLTLGTILKINGSGHLDFAYALAGFRTDFLIASKDAKIIDPATSVEFWIYEDLINELRTISWGALIGLGFNISPMVYVEIETNPSIGSISKSDVQTVKNNYWAVRLGLNINR